MGKKPDIVVVLEDCDMVYGLEGRRHPLMKRKTIIGTVEVFENDDGEFVGKIFLHKRYKHLAGENRVVSVSANYKRHFIMTREYGHWKLQSRGWSIPPDLIWHPFPKFTYHSKRCHHNRFEVLEVEHVSH